MTTMLKLYLIALILDIGGTRGITKRILITIRDTSKEILIECLISWRWAILLALRAIIATLQVIVEVIDQ